MLNAIYCTWLYISTSIRVTYPACSLMFGGIVLLFHLQHMLLSFVLCSVVRSLLLRVSVEVALHWAQIESVSAEDDGLVGRRWCREILKLHLQRVFTVPMRYR